MIGDRLNERFHAFSIPINIAAALCSTKAYNSAYAKGEQMINETMYARGAESSIIREIFSYGLERKAQIGAENVFDFSLGNPSVPAPAAVAESIKKALELPSDQLHGYTPRTGPAAVSRRRGRVAQPSLRYEL